MPTLPWSEIGASTGEALRAECASDTWPLALHRLRAGAPTVLPAAVAQPTSVDEVCRILEWCNRRGVAVVPRGGGSGVCGGVTGRPDALALDLRTLAGVESIDGPWCTVLAGTNGADYEAHLNAQGLTGGHYPQSLALSTVGGWLAARGAGQMSSVFGAADELVRGLDVVLADGTLVSIPARNQTSAGPDLARLFCGSEGTLGVIVRATMRVFELPALDTFTTRRFGSIETALEALRRTHGSRAIVRVYDQGDAAWSLHEEGILLIAIGPIPDVGGEDVGPAAAERWFAKRYDGVDSLRRILQRDGQLGPYGVVDTMEVAAPWHLIGPLYAALRGALEPLGVTVLTHISHTTTDGACLYLTLAIVGESDDDAAERYEAAWDAGMAVTRMGGGTISHHHGVGRLKAAWLRDELGEAGWTLLRTLKTALDPRGILNPQNLGL